MIEIRDITKTYKTGDLVQRALDGVSVTFRESEFVAVLGPSGSGKTTFLNILGGFDHADSGDIVVNGTSTRDYTDAEWDTYRNHRVGFIFQSYNLIPHQTILANVELALTLAGVDRAERERRARAALERVGLGAHVNKKPSQLSGGQMQRVAIARALVNDPEIVLADEPTGALDTETGIQVMDLLAEVARERLVIMVTHNPQLAEDYATRIVRIKDGRLAGDTCPVTENEVEAARAAALAHPDKGPAHRSSMGLLTALSLSFTNLMTKKGRTIMTAFAGSIGIIGIAAILALSNGVNGYIAKVEQDTLSSYPLTIARQSYDLTSMMTGDSASSEGSESEEGESGDGAEVPSVDAEGGRKVDLKEPIPIFTMLSDMFASVKSNDMASFKGFLDKDAKELDGEVSAIQYDYGITPLVYRSDTSEGPVRLSPNAMTTAMTGGASSAAMAGTMMTGATAFNEMIDNPELLDEQYDVVAGRWAKAADECVLVLSARGKISDFTLYSMGVLDPAALDRMVERTMSGAGEVHVPEVDADFTYDDALGTTFKVLAASDSYRRNAETGGWTDMSGDASFMAGQVEHGLDLKIVGIVQPSPTAKSAALSQGIAYTSGLTDELMKRAANSEIVRAQLAEPEVDVFTGKPFATLQEEAKRGVDLASLFSVDESALRAAFKVDASKLGAGLDLSGFDFAGLDMGGVDIDISSALEGVDLAGVLSAAPMPDFEGILGDLASDPVLDKVQLEQVSKLSGAFVQRFLMAWLPEHGAGLRPGEPDFGEKLVEQFVAYAGSTAPEGGAALLDEVTAVAGKPVAERLDKIVRTYVSDRLAPYMATALKDVAAEVSARLATAVGAQLQEGLGRTFAAAAPQLAQRLAANMQQAFSVDGGAFARAIHFNMDAEDLSSLMASYANAGRLTYDNNLATLGYADEADPQSVSIYPVDFEAKDAVLGAIDRYNEDMRAAGEDDKVIVYTDYMGVLMGSVTSIVNMISLVLIAFVSISLVVSSIMIGIITYISVLERKKEIGILRAMGASKRNIANVFNAETFIEGLIAGVLAIAVVVAVSFPVNAWALAVHHVENVMRLPISSAIGLILISVALTVIAGLIPSRNAARRDPVEALRSE
ncbi:ABC transporter ATP-binding protein/permease [Collinsella intestinalis]|uniref:ATP-binding cassette domain-containing protein n=1 Tax=Collinsella intestinalis TaxID=147207 RepID=A0A414NFE3_9ACTN|nr:ABC transporter ATP-binding protein/permease [Collinsella intestinalis]RHF38506.1 ATP-binding cassette domain-containing protein [Collinsella intestinalis]